MDTYLDADTSAFERDTASLEVYKREANEIVERFLSGQTNFPACIAALDSAFAALIPDLDDLGQLRAVKLANNQTVMQEMHKRDGRIKRSQLVLIAASFPPR